MKALKAALLALELRGNLWQETAGNDKRARPAKSGTAKWRGKTPEK